MPAALRARLLRLAEQAWPNECCGVLIGHRRGDRAVVHRLQPCANVAREPRRRYEIDAAELVTAQRLARDVAEQIVGFYHSHPEHDASPSPQDREQACWPGVSYLIVAVHQGQAAELRCFLLDGELVPEELQTIAAEPVNPAT